MVEFSLYRTRSNKRINYKAEKENSKNLTKTQTMTRH